MPLEEKMDSGQFVVLAELEPPKGADFSAFMANANQVKGRVDALVVPEMANAVMKASSLGGCLFLQTRGFETVMQACCRDRNRLALQADLLAASALGVRNVMVLKGEDINYGDHHQARDVFDLDPETLLKAIQGLQSGKDMAGIQLQGVPRYLLGTTFNAGATGGALDIEIEELNRKIELGVRFVVTTPVFDLFRFQKTFKRLDAGKVAILPTVLLLKSAGMARYIDRNIRHISIPQELIRALQKAPDKVNHCIKLAGETISSFREMGVAGVMVSTIGWEDKLPQVLDHAKL